MRTIWKFKVMPGSQKIDIPTGYKILLFGIDPQDELCLWAEVEAQAAKTQVPILIMGTGGYVDTFKTIHFGSCVQGLFVWHLYLRT